MKFSEKLYALRKSNSLSQEQLAEKLNISRQAVSKWETGETYPDVDKVLLLSNIFDISVDELLCIEVKKEPNLQSSRPKKKNMIIVITVLISIVSLIIGLTIGLFVGKSVSLNTINQNLEKIEIVDMLYTVEIENKYLPMYRVVFTVIPNIGCEDIKATVTSIEDSGKKNKFDPVYEDNAFTFEMKTMSQGTFNLSITFENGEKKRNVPLIRARIKDKPILTIEGQELWRMGADK